MVDVYKVLPASEWRQAVATGAYDGSADDRRDGFVHLSTAAQLPGTLAKHFRDQTGLVLVAFRSETLGADLKWEPSRGGDLFPHLYASLPAAAAAWSRPLQTGPDGIPRLPADLALDGAPR